jgi:hypothetical protein
MDDNENTPLSRSDLDNIHKRIDAAFSARRKISISDIRVSIVGVFAALLALGTPTGLVIANHYKIAEHLANTRIHADEHKSELFGGVAYAGEVAQKERQVYFTVRSLHCGVPNATATLCSSSYPDGAFPVIPAYPPSPWGTSPPTGK